MCPRRSQRQRLRFLFQENKRDTNGVSNPLRRLQQQQQQQGVTPSSWRAAPRRRRGCSPGGRGWRRAPRAPPAPGGSPSSGPLSRCRSPCGGDKNKGRGGRGGGTQSDRTSRPALSGRRHTRQRAAFSSALSESL